VRNRFTCVKIGSNLSEKYLYTSVLQSLSPTICNLGSTKSTVNSKDGDHVKKTGLYICGRLIHVSLSYYVVTVRA